MKLYEDILWIGYNSEQKRYIFKNIETSTIKWYFIIKKKAAFIQTYGKNKITSRYKTRQITKNEGVEIGTFIPFNIKEQVDVIWFWELDMLFNDLKMRIKYRYELEKRKNDNLRVIQK